METVLVGLIVLAAAGYVVRMFRRALRTGHPDGGSTGGCAAGGCGCGASAPVGTTPGATQQR